MPRRARYLYDPDYMEVTALREAVVKWIAKGHPWMDLARVLPVTYPTSTHVQRLLGMKPTYNTTKWGSNVTRPYYAKSIRIQYAMAMLDVMGLDPHEIDL